MPLFLFVSHANRDAALLAHPPASDLGVDYIKLLDEPVAFAHTLDPTKPPQHPFLTLRAYWSAQRRDIQTTTQSLYELNEGGGNYTVLSTIGLVAVALTAGQPSAQFAPLRLSYDPVREDAASAPLSGADLDRLVAGAAYPTGRTIGFVAKASCRICNVSSARFAQLRPPATLPCAPAQCCCPLLRTRRPLALLPWHCASP